MSQGVNPLAKKLPGYGPFPYSGLPGRVVAISPCSRVDSRICWQLKNGSVKCALKGASFVCNASSGGRRRNSDSQKQNRQSFSRNRNRQNEDGDGFENLDESTRLTSKNGPLISLSNPSKFQATAAPGPREEEIVELFRKVQSKLRARAAVKEDKKVEATKGKGKENENVDSLLKLLKKYSLDQGKQSNSGGLAAAQHERNSSRNEARTTSSLNSHKKRENDVPEPNGSSFTRPPSNFRRKSPIPHMKFEPVYSSEDSINSAPTGENKQPFEMRPKAAQLPDLDPEEQPKQELESSLLDADGFNEPSSEAEASSTDWDSENQQRTKEEDLNSLKVPELRALAKSRGLKGFSKMKKGELVELLSG